jgi:hypothetical protein
MTDAEIKRLRKLCEKATPGLDGAGVAAIISVWKQSLNALDVGKSDHTADAPAAASVKPSQPDSGESPGLTMPNDTAGNGERDARRVTLDMNPGGTQSNGVTTLNTIGKNTPTGSRGSGAEQPQQMECVGSTTHQGGDASIAVSMYHDHDSPLVILEASTMLYHGRKVENTESRIWLCAVPAATHSRALADSDFIAASRTAIPALLDERDAILKELNNFRDAFKIVSEERDALIEQRDAYARGAMDQSEAQQRSERSKGILREEIAGLKSEDGRAHV